MKYVIKNLRQFYKEERVIFILLTLGIIISTIMIDFSIGLFNDYQNRKLSEIYEFRHFAVEFNKNENEVITKGMLERSLKDLPNDFTNAVDMFLVMANVEEQGVIQCRFIIQDKKYAASTVFRNNLLKYKRTTAYFNNIQEEEGQLVALIQADYLNSPIPTDAIRIQGKDYKIIGQQIWCPTPIVPFSSLEEKTVINKENGLLISFSKAMTTNQYDVLESVLKKNLQDSVVIPPMPSVIDSGVPLYNTMLLISVFIAVVAALNISILYRYILIKRAHILAVYRICGLSKCKIIAIYIGECMMILIPVHLISTAAYHFLVLPLIAYSLEYMEPIYDLKNYFRLFCIYIIVSLIVLLVNVGLDVYKVSISQILQRKRV